jgi:transposase
MARERGNAKKRGMETQPIIVEQERIDDVPLLLGMMRRMKIAETLDKHLGHHHLHEGLSNGNLALGWLAYILSESDHRKSAVQDWATRIPHTLESFFATPLRVHEFSDDRLGILLKNLAAADWDDIESELFYSCFDVYQLPKEVFRLDATTSCGYHTIDPDGIMQLGHSKDHRPDLPQLKIMAAVTQPLAFPVSTSVVAGNQTDDGLYWSTIVEVKQKVGGSGLLFVGDCKMASLDTRARIADGGDYYLTPLPNTGETAKQLGSWIDTALQKEEEGELQAIYQATEAGHVPELIGKGYEFSRTLQSKVDEREVTWTERVQVVQSVAHQTSQKARLERGLQQAEGELGGLTLSGKGRKVWRQEQELHRAIAAITQGHQVEGLLSVVVQREEKETKKYGKPGRPGEAGRATVEVEVRYRITQVRRNDEQIEQKQKRMGWRALALHAPEERLTLAGSVLTYREGGGLERPFHQIKDKPLGIRPLFVKLPEQVLGLTRLLLIALRVLTLIEIVLRARLAASGEQLDGMHEGQKNKKEGKPTAKRMLRAVAGLEMTLSLMEMGEKQWWYLPPLPHLLVRILELLGLSTSLYTNLTNPCPCLPPRSLAPFVLDSSG